jgi:NDP-sugar pyrophosphorylase family protein
MQAVIMAAGKGVRMQPLTLDTPKSLLKVGSKAILDRTLAELPSEIDEVIIVIGYLGEKIRAHVAENYPDLKVKFVETEPLGTGYAVMACKPLLKDEFLVLNGDDLYKKEDLQALVSNDLAVLAKDASKEPGFPQEFERFGHIVANDSGDFESFEFGTRNGENLVVIGGYKLNRNFFDYELVRTSNGEFGLPQTLFSMAGKHKIKVVKASFWIPIGFPNDLSKAAREIGE